MTELDDIKRSIEQMPIDEIAPIVRSAVGDDTAVVEPGWTVETLSAESIGQGTVGILRTKLIATVSNRVVESSLIIKVVNRNAIAEFEGVAGTFNSPEREIKAYESGFFDRLNGGFRAAPCHGITRSGNADLLWMEDLSDSVAYPWGADEFLLSAHDVGVFNGTWPEERAPEGDWLDREFITNQPTFYFGSGYLDPVADPKNKTVLNELTRRSGVKNPENMLGGFSEIVETISGLPRGVNHNDFHSRNAFFRYEKQGPITYAIDWATAGLGPIGFDCGTLTGGSLIWTENEARLIAEIEGQMFAEYLSGLAEAGYSYDRDVVRLGSLSSVVVYITGQALVAALPPESPTTKRITKRFGVEGDEFFDQLALRLRMFKPLFDEAVSLARQLG